MVKHPQYQIIRAFADGWEIEAIDYDNTMLAPINIPFSKHISFRIIPNSAGWLPWYPHEDAECPIDGPVDIVLACGNVETIKNWSWWADMNVTHYRPHKEISKRDRIHKELELYCQCQHMLSVLDKIMEIVEE